MTMLSQQALQDAITATVQASGSAPEDQAGLEEALLTLRSRIRSAGRLDTLVQQRAGLSRALGPLVTWIDREPLLRTLDQGTRSDLLWNLFTAGVSRTQSAESFPLITGDEAQWSDLVSGLSSAAPPPEVMVQRSATGILHLQVLLLGLICLAADPWMPSDRFRFYTTAGGTFLVACAGMMWTFGWTTFPGGQSPSIPSRNPSPGVLNPGARAFEPVGEMPPLEPLPEDVPFDHPPTGVPPVPSTEQQVGMHRMTSQAPLTSWTIGQRCRLLAIPPYNSLAGQCGRVSSVKPETLGIQLDSGLTLQDVPPRAIIAETTVDTTNTASTEASNLTYAPLAGLGGGSTRLQLQAARPKDAVIKAHGLAATTPQWGALFWQAVRNEKEIYGLEPELGNVLQSHGYVGDATIGPPRPEELRKSLQEIETLGAPAHGTGGTYARIADVNHGENPEQMAWHLKLPADLQRAAPELYRNIRAEGVSSVRQWVNDQHPTLEAKQTAGYQDLFSAATIIDFELADCKSEAAVMHKLATSDSLEIQLRKLGSHVRRTKDKFGASRMLGVRAPGSQSDIAPKWLLDEANLYSKVEWQRTERGQKMSRQDHGDHGPKTKFAGKFRGRGGGSKGGGKGSKGGSSGPPKTQG